MAYTSLADFLEELAEAGELARVGAEVDPNLEIAEITRRVADAGGPALLFERVRGRSIAVVTNLLGTPCRACRALCIESLDQIAARIESLVQEHTPQNWFDRLKMTGDETGANKFRPKSVKSGACQQVVHLGRDVNLTAFPLIKSWPGESGPAVTGGTLITESRDAQTRGATACPLVALDENRLAVVDDGHSVFSRHWTDHCAAGQRMPAAVVLGGDPGAVIAASLELPPSIDAYQAAGLLCGKGLDVIKCRTHALEVPADADLVFEGYLDPDVSAETIEVAGAGGSHYRLPRPAPVFHVAAITHRTRPIFPALVDSGLAGESGVLAGARERMVLAALRTTAPDVVDLHLPPLGGMHHFALVSMRKRYPFHARQIAAALWGSEALKFTKFLILVDHDVNVHDAGRVLELVGANVAPERDVFAFDGPAHSSDHASGPAPLGRHLAIDATAKIAGEQSGTWPELLDAGEETRRQVTARWAEYKLAVPDV
jgi:4-hydroxy-3-polyprenylbenzoate decarboxylase